MSDIKLTGEQEAVLRSQVFDALHPGALLHDFAVLLDHVGARGVEVRNKDHLLSSGAVRTIDARLARPLRVPMERPRLGDHPYVQGLYLLFRASGLARVKGKGDSVRVVVNADVLKQWNDLASTEQYFALLDAWLIVSQPEMVGGRSNDGESLVEEWTFTMDMHEKRDGNAIVEKLFDTSYRYRRDLYNVALADLFGLIAVEHAARPQKEWKPVKVRATPYGAALLELLAGWILADEEEDVAEPEEFDSLQPLLQPLFPASHEKRMQTEEEPARDGVHVFTVSLGDVSRVIAVAHDHTLHDLMNAILRSIKFDSEHLYEFRYRDALGRDMAINHPACNDGISADEVEVGMLPQQPGEVIDLVYDFGDNWRFKVKLERIDPPGSIKKLPKVLESHGKAPEQYPRWE